MIFDDILKVVYKGWFWDLGSLLLSKVKVLG
jgi:hypothetical protein